MNWVPLVGCVAAFATEGEPMDAVAAEHERLSQEMRSLADRATWSGVDHVWRRIEALGVEPSQADHVVVARAAEARGNMANAMDHWQAASKLEGNHQELAASRSSAIAGGYGPVDLRTVNPSAELRVLSMPFDPSARRAVDFAVAEAEDSGSFSGLLPPGEYTFEGRPFMAEPGISHQIHVTKKTRRRRRKSP